MLLTQFWNLILMYWFFPGGQELSQMENMICSLFFTSRKRPTGNFNTITFSYKIKWKSELAFAYNRGNWWKQARCGHIGQQLDAGEKELTICSVWDMVYGKKISQLFNINYLIHKIVTQQICSTIREVEKIYKNLSLYKPTKPIFHFL